MSDLPIDPERLRGLLDKDFKAPDIVGHVEGWRAWQTSVKPPPFGAAPKLYSVTWHYYWAPRLLSRAECSCPDVPNEKHSCGFYSAKSLEHLQTMAYHLYDTEGGFVRVVGRVANWGKVIEGTQGWRSEKSYPVELFVPFEAWALAAPLSQAYGVPVSLKNTLKPTRRKAA